ncbi:MAG: serine hydrolase, partial [Phaeodactylibacter sp.]|nr:serine hydrolase [Phaeodactylibacter sp.]
WAYNNAAMALLGDLVARHQQSTWKELVREKLFEPLDMNDSYFRIGEAQESR